ncbi:MAG: O-antigen ligase family protein [Bacteroidota bacterium]|nr:O-antigen ligase family protein [Bacteroidota bacterium]
MQTRLSKLNYLYIFFAIVWVPFQKGILIVDGAARSLLFFTVLIFLINLNDRISRRLISHSPISIWGILIIFSIVNLYLKGYDGGYSILEFLIFQLILPFNILFLTTREIIVNKLKTVSFLFKVFLAHLIFSIISYGTLLLDPNLRHSDSFVNNLALNVIFLLFFSILSNLHKIFKAKILFLIFPITTLIIIYTQTRKALGAVLIFVLFAILSKFKVTVPKFFGLIVSLMIFFMAGNYLVENTVIGKRIKEIKTVGESANTSNIEALSFLGDRAYFYVEGWRIFKTNPITGIGLTNFIHKDQYNITIHSEYMVQLVENGIIGFVIFLIFIIILGKGLIRNIWKNKKETNYFIFLLGGFLGVVFISFTAWIYSFPQYFAFFGVAIGYIKLADFNKRKKNKNNII